MDPTLLIQDLLSPPATQLGESTPSAITLHLSTIPLNEPSLAIISQLVSAIGTSPSLWRGQAARYKSAPHWRPLHFNRAQEVYNALAQSFQYRAAEITKEFGTGWRARREFAVYLEAYLEGLNLSENETDAQIHPQLSLLASSASLAGLQRIKSRKEKLYVGGSKLMGRAESQVLLAWNQFFLANQVEGTTGVSSAYLAGSSRTASSNEFPAWLAAQVFPMFPVESLALGPVSSLLDLLSVSLSNAFAGGRVFDSLAEDLHSTTDGIAWTVPSASHTLLSQLVANPIFTTLGPLSRAIGRLIESAGISTSALEPAAIRSVKNCLNLVERLAQRVQKGWSNTIWSDLISDSELTKVTRERKEAWTLLKSFLFAVTLIDSSLLVIVSPTRGQIPTRLQLDLAQQALRVLGKTYFITIKFGSEGFSAWQGVWTGLIEIVSEETRAGVENLLRELQPNELGSLHCRRVARSEATFYFNVSEVLMKSLGEDYVENIVLKGVRPYLQNNEYADTFESAHSVVLAVFATNKRVANEFAPFYIQLLLEAYPSLMTASQIRLAFTTVIRCVSNSDDALAWYCITRLIEKTKSLPTSSAAPQPSEGKMAEKVTLENSAEPAQTSSTSRFDSDETRIDSTNSLSELEKQALSLPRGHFLLTLIDQTTAVNLILLRNLLQQIWQFVKEEPAGEGREALVAITFGTLGQGLDSIKREEGTKWWMRRGNELLAEQPTP